MQIPYIPRRLRAQTRREWMHSAESGAGGLCRVRKCFVKLLGNEVLLSPQVLPNTLAGRLSSERRLVPDLSCELFHQFNPSSIQLSYCVRYGNSNICDCITPPPPPTPIHLQHCTCSVSSVVIVIVAVFTETPTSLQAPWLHICHLNVPRAAQH